MIIRLLHLLIASSLLVSSVGVPIYEHVCKKNGTTTSFYVKAKTCCSKKSYCNKGISCKLYNSQNTSAEFSKNPCCKDLTHFIKAATLGVKQIGNSFWYHIQFVKTEFTLTNTLLSNTFLSHFNNYYKGYHPPNIIQDIYRMILVIRC